MPKKQNIKKGKIDGPCTKIGKIDGLCIVFFYA